MLDNAPNDELDALLRELARTPPTNVASIAEGEKIGRFTVLRELGRGGFGVVYEARDPTLGRHVAVKLIRALEDHADVFREAEAVARLQHPNIVTLFDFGWHDDAPYLVLELLRGETLQDRLTRGPLALREAVALTVQITRGLVAAHDAGVCHHDLKPGNVFLTDTGGVKLLDFGIAALAASWPVDAEPRPRAGTPGYAAPERIRGEAGDHRSDLYLVGVVLCAALGVRPPVDTRGHLADALDAVPGALLPLVTALLEPAPEARPPSAAALLEALLSIESDLGLAESEARSRIRAMRYVKSGDADIAYEVVGDGPFDLLLVPPFVSHLECWWDEPEGARFVGGLANVARLILFDKRGTGMSERFPGHAPPGIDERIEDMRAVLDAVGTRKVALLGVSEGVQLSVAFAARYPDATLALVLFGGAAGALRAEHARALCDRIATAWGTGVLAPIFAPSVANDARLCRWLGRIERLSATPSGAAALLEMLTHTDVHDRLAAVRAPALVVHRTGDRVVPCAAGRALAREIAGARFVEQAGDDHLPMFGDTAGLLAEIERFLVATCAPVSRLDEPLARG